MFKFFAMAAVAFALLMPASFASAAQNFGKGYRHHHHHHHHHHVR